MKSLGALLAGSVVGTAAALGACSSPHGGSSTGADASAICPPSPTLTCQNPQNAPTYSQDVAPLIQERCAQCHFAGGVVAASFNLSTYTDVVNLETAIVSQLYGCLMPPVGGNSMYGIAPGTVSALSADEVNTIIQWIECGAKND
jgi:uncharacterized membrane protein